MVDDYVVHHPPIQASSTIYAYMKVLKDLGCAVCRMCEVGFARSPIWSCPRRWMYEYVLARHLQSSL